jgi:mannose/cellobiose epimerase-like protein (N-acyl-D-glucosamine 2-epimerase family)
MKAYIDWMKERALPIWSSQGFDAAAGRFHERLDRSGSPLDVPHRAMVQARQIYVFAHAAALGWFPEGRSAAETAMVSLLRDFAEDVDGATSFAFAIDTATRRIVSPVRDAYAHAFVLFAVAQLYALNGDQALLALADRIIAFIDRHLLDPRYGGVRDAHPVTSSEKRQNPQMHLLEAYIALESAAPGRGYGERADALVTLFCERMFSKDHGVLLEYFSENWSDHPDEGKAGLFEPGHHYEWVWLLHQHEKMTGAKLRPWRVQLADPAGRHGISERGLIYDELSCDMRVVKASHRLWPHTEAIKAATVHHAEGDPDALPFARRMAAVLGEHFLDTPFPGGWTDQLAPDLSPLVDYVPASSLYHLFLAAAEADAGFRLAKDAALSA